MWNDVRNVHTLAWMVTGIVLSQRSSIPAWLSYIHSRATFAQSSERRACQVQKMWSLLETPWVRLVNHKNL